MLRRTGLQLLYASWQSGEKSGQDFCLTEDQAALMNEIGFGQDVGVDCRKIRSTNGLVNYKLRKVARYDSPTNGTIESLVNASEEINQLHNPKEDSTTACIEMASMNRPWM